MASVVTVSSTTTLTLTDISTFDETAFLNSFKATLSSAATVTLIYKVTQKFSMDAEITEAECLGIMAGVNSVAESAIACSVSTGRRLSSESRRLATTADVVISTADKAKATTAGTRSTTDTTALLSTALATAGKAITGVSSEEPTVAMDIVTVVPESEIGVLQDTTTFQANVVSSMSTAGVTVTVDQLTTIVTTPAPTPPPTAAGDTFAPTQVPAPGGGGGGVPTSQDSGEEQDGARVSATLAASAFLVAATTFLLL